MIIATTDTIPGATIVETLGLVRGSTVRARHIGRDIMAGLRNIVGGEVSEYTKLLAEAREQSLQRMIESAEGIGGQRHRRHEVHHGGRGAGLSGDSRLWHRCQSGLGLLSRTS